MSLSSRTISRSTRTLFRSANTSRILPSCSSRTIYVAQSPVAPAFSRTSTGQRAFHLTAPASKGLQPDSEDPTPPETHTGALGDATHVTEPADITTEEYHEISDEYIDRVVAQLEAMAEDPERGVEVEYSVCGSLSTNSPCLENAILRILPSALEFYR